MIIQSERVWINQQFNPAQLHIHNKKIVKITSYNSHPVDHDYGKHRIVPGFIDNHIHGSYGVDTNDADSDGLINVMKGLVSEGVTSFCPTTVTQSKDVLVKALKNVAKVSQQTIKGAQIVGIHLEGPFLNKAFKGAQPEQHIIPSNVDLFKEFYSASQELIKIITMATELDTDFELTRFCVDRGVVVSIGHSSATYDEAMMAVAHGASSMTHVFNGMSGLHHRQYNLAGAAHRIQGVYAEIIADGNHVAWPAIYTLMMAKGPYHNILITDALSVKGIPHGNYELGEQKIEVKEDGSAYLKGTNTLSGSTLRMNIGLKNLVEYAQVPFQYALNAATINPATLLNLGHRKGKLAYNYDADFVVLDQDYEVIATYVYGECVYQNKKAVQ